jgi:beta-glucanase (GH16 family)
VVDADRWTFTDEFDGASLDTSKWTALNYPNDEAPYCWTNSAVTESAGNLRLQAYVDSTCPNHEGYTGGYSAGQVVQRSSSFLYGHVEARIKFGAGGGLNSAFWLLGANCQTTLLTTELNTGTCNWPNTGSDEIDIAEEYPPGQLTSINQQIHSNGFDAGCFANPVSFDPTADYHVYQLWWQPNLVEWSIDGTITCRATTHVPTTPMFVIFDIAPSCPCTGLPTTTLVDYVRISTKNQ